eukprot:gene11946-13182_t
MAEFEAFRDVQTPQTLQPCSCCGRKFNPETLARHERVCANQKQRKVFNSSKQRTELLAPDLQRVKKTSPAVEPPKKSKASWRAKHENLIATLKAARGEGPAVALIADPGSIDCPYCNRNFNEHAAERHIPFCKDQKARQQMKSKPAKTKLEIRTQYKPPLPGAKKSHSGVNAEGSIKQRTPNRAGHQSTSAGTVKQSPTTQQSPSSRSRAQSDQSEMHDPRALRKKASPSPPSQRRNQQLGSTRTLESNSNNNSKYLASDYYHAPRASSGSSTDSDVRRVASGHSGQNDPSWFKDLQQTESPSIFPEKAEKSARHSGRTRQPRNEDVFSFDEKPLKPKRRDDHRYDDEEDFSGFESKPAAIGVVKPSSRKASGMAEERTGSGRRKLANFCHECGTKYPVENAKFCCECGIKRMHIEV